jgi:hypothetical protein
VLFLPGNTGHYWQVRTALITLITVTIVIIVIILVRIIMIAII